MSRKIDILLIMRGLLALSVVVWHFIFNANSYPAWISIPGRTAVWIFFGISGYVISYGFFSKRYLLNAADIKRFYINRFLRIYPLFFLLTVLGLLTAYVVKGKILLGVADIPAELLMLQFNHNYAINSVFWTLGIEIQFYLVTPLLIYFFLYPFRKPFAWYAGMYLLFLIWLPAAFFLGGQSFDGRNLLSNMTHFLTGMIACRFVLQGKHSKINNYLLGGAIMVILLSTNYLYRDNIRVYWTLGTVLIDLLIFLAVILHYQLSEKNIDKRNAGLRVLGFLGVISYGIYAWHPYLSDYFPAIQNNIMVAVITTVIVAFVSYQFVEKPILNMKRGNR